MNEVGNNPDLIAICLGRGQVWQKGELVPAVVGRCSHIISDSGHAILPD